MTSKVHAAVDASRPRAMRVVENAWEASDLPRDVVVTIGNFDGIHRGQRVIIDRVLDRARELDQPAVLVTFEPHPLAVLKPTEAPPRLMTATQKRQILEGLGLDHMLVVDFSPEIAGLSAAVFAEGFLHDRLRAREVFVGSRFVFGHGREGNLALLCELGERHGFRAHGVPELDLDGAPISSTRIRAAVAKGRVEMAAEMLGRPYSLVGTVERGQARGRTLGWPTINVATSNELLPADGVYLSDAVLDGETHHGVTNIGLRPTFGGETERIVESHLLDFDSDVYGSEVELRLLRRLRGERKFSGPEALKEQIGADVARAREYFGHPLR